MKKNKDPCEGCVWGKRIMEDIIFCPFPKCVREKEAARREARDGRREETGVDRRA